MNFSRFSGFFRTMASSNIVPLTPIGVRGMKVLDRDKFLRNYTVPVLKVKEENLSRISSACKNYLLKIQNFKPIQDANPGNQESHDNKEHYKKFIYIDPYKVNNFNDLSQDDRTTLAKYGITENNFFYKQIQFKYENWSFETIFKAVLPENQEIVSSFSQIGHIIHLNLREHLLEYQFLIGQVLVDKIKTCKTVVNKSNAIDNTFRNFSMEVIAGEEDFLVTVKENNCVFQFDFSKVYWNPRLCKEHERILTYLQANDVLFDVFCGVGPFTIPAAKRRIRVFANDLNPDSYYWLIHNAKSNKVKDTFFKAYNQDGKDFICGVFKDFIVNLCKGNEKLDTSAKIHVTMNLPALATEFLKYFNGLIDDQNLLDKFNCNIIIYVYCFAVGEDPVKVAKQMVIDNIGCNISECILNVFEVRNVSPKKEMMRVTFKLTKEVLFGLKIDLTEPPSKKVCLMT